ncbi:hypothetical protein HD806DRAFT_506361 [Xylariaceae sp. AK1471]|nr:hypothetical protein HD806DRAFT_506361 [Xylariaceae sp. AK1471]
MQPGKYPRILPAVSITQPGESSQSSSSGGTGKESKKRPSSQPRPGACIECRNRKTKCDGHRPACANCTKRGLAICVYPERLVNGHKAIELLEMFKNLSEERSTALLRLLRERGDAATVISEFRGGSDESSDSPSGPNLWGPRRHRSTLESELMANNPKAYPVLLPIDPTVLARSNLLRPVPQASLPDHSGVTAPRFDNVAPNTVPSEFLEPVEQPSKYCDDRLRYLQVGFWTDMKVSNDFVARVISLYIRTDHPLLGLFNTHLLITDLVSQRTKYCSRFLFHALMYLGCQMHSAFDGDAMKHASGFRQEAEDLWKTEQDSYLSMAGAILLSISLMGHGKDRAVLHYATDAMKIGERLGLFSNKLHPATAPQSSIEIYDDNLSAKCFAAWGAFNWNVMVSMFYRQPGSETPASAPTLPIPGETSAKERHKKRHEAQEEEDEEADEEGYPSEEILLGKTFPVLCNFWRLVHRVRWIYYSVQESPPVNLRTTLVECAYRELIAWAETLPSFLLRREQSPHYVTVFHIWLHTAILDMWQPFVFKETREVPELKTFSARDRTPDAAYTASANQLKHLIVEYRSKYAASTYSILWHNGLIYLANAMLRCTDPEWRLYLLLCIYGYERLNRPYRISEVITQGLLTMTMRDTNMTGSEAYKLMEELRERGLLHVKEDVEDKVRATFMIDLNLALTNPEAAKAENMAEDFEDLAMFQDLIDLDRMQM